MFAEVEKLGPEKYPSGNLNYIASSNERNQTIEEDKFNKGSHPVLSRDTSVRNLLKLPIRPNNTTALP